MVGKKADVKSVSIHPRPKSRVLHQLNRLFIYSFLGHEKVVRLLIENGANVTLTNIYDGNSALIFAADHGSIPSSLIFKKCS